MPISWPDLRASEAFKSRRNKGQDLLCWFHLTRKCQRVQEDEVLHLYGRAVWPSEDPL